MSALRFPHIKAEPGQTRMSAEEFRQQNTQEKKKGGTKTSSGGRNGKFNAIAVETPDGRFDSKMEYARFLDLQLLERAGVISNLRRQVPYPLMVGDTLITTYIADFVYEEKGNIIVEDVKGFRTRDYLMKKKLMKKINDIDIYETGKNGKAKKSRRH